MTPGEWERFRAFHASAERARFVGSLVLFVVVYAAAMWLLWS